MCPPNRVLIETYAVFFIPHICPIDIFQWDIIIFIEPLHDKWFEPTGTQKDKCKMHEIDVLSMVYLRGIFRHCGFKLWHITTVGVVEPFAFKVQVHVGGTQTQTMLFVFFQCILHIDSKQSPHCGRTHMSNVELLWKSKCQTWLSTYSRLIFICFTYWFKTGA